MGPPRCTCPQGRWGVGKSSEPQVLLVVLDGGLLPVFHVVFPMESDSRCDVAGTAQAFPGLGDGVLSLLCYFIPVRGDEMDSDLWTSCWLFAAVWEARGN